MLLTLSLKILPMPFLIYRIPPTLYVPVIVKCVLTSNDLSKMSISQMLRILLSAKPHAHKCHGIFSCCPFRTCAHVHVR